MKLSYQIPKGRGFKCKLSVHSLLTVLIVSNFAYKFDSFVFLDISPLSCVISVLFCFLQKEKLLLWVRSSILS